MERYIALTLQSFKFPISYVTVMGNIKSLDLMVDRYLDLPKGSGMLMTRL